MQAVVLAGGKGTRLGADGDAPPKPLTPILGLALLEHLLAWLAQEGVRDVVLCTAYRAEQVERAIGDGSRFGLRIRYSVETKPLGTAGAVKLATPLLEERFFVVYGDVLAEIDLAAMYQAHRASGAMATLAVHPNSHPFDSDRVIADAAGHIERLVRKEDRLGPEAGALCNAALYVLERGAIDAIADDGVARDFARDVFPELLRSGAALFAYRTAEYLKDMGTKARCGAVEADLSQGVVRAMRRGRPRAAVLLDRDGVLNEDAPYITRADELRLLPGVAKAVRRLNEAHVLTAVCTNQPGVARGMINEAELHAIHRYLEGKLGEEGAWVDGIFACPHHSHRGFDGERSDLKVFCTCRKPLAGLLFQAREALSADLARSIFVGDRTTDLRAARAAGALGVGVRTGNACLGGPMPLTPEDPIVPSVVEAIALFLDTAPSWDPWVDAIVRARVLLLGGASRTGKTIAAAALRLRLAARGVPCLHLSLDRFIAPLSTRAMVSRLAERTRLDDASRAVSALVGGAAVLVPGYDPLTRETAPSQAFHWGGRGVLIVEGLLATSLGVDGALRIALEADRGVLDDRRSELYAWKNASRSEPWPDASAEQRREEDDAVSQATARVDVRLALDDDHRLGVSSIVR